MNAKLYCVDTGWSFDEIGDDHYGGVNPLRAISSQFPAISRLSDLACQNG